MDTIDRSISVDEHGTVQRPKDLAGQYFEQAIERFFNDRDGGSFGGFSIVPGSHRFEATN